MARRGRGRSSFGRRRGGFGRSRFGHSSFGRSRYRRSGPSPMQRAMWTRPATVPGRIVFPKEMMGNGFSINEFNEAATQGRVSTNDVQRVINALRSHPDAKYAVNGGIILLIPLLMCAFFGLMVFFMINFASSNPALIAPIMIGSMCTLFGIIICITFSLQKKSMEKLTKRQNSFQQILNNFNSTEFNAKDCAWKCGQYGAWISLELNFILRNQANQAVVPAFLPNGVPNPNSGMVGMNNMGVVMPNGMNNNMMMMSNPGAQQMNMMGMGQMQPQIQPPTTHFGQNQPPLNMPNNIQMGVPVGGQNNNFAKGNNFTPV